MSLLFLKGRFCELILVRLRSIIDIHRAIWYNSKKRKGTEMTRGRKILMAGLMSLGLVGSMNVYAAEGQSVRWEGSGDDWKVKTQDGSGYLVNSWFQDDVTGHWYMLGADGKMFSGLITDNSTGKSYLLNINHDGTFGRMITTDGNYDVNGRQIGLKFNQAHDGTFGAITNGLDSVREAGINETKLASIPTDNGGSSDLGSGSGGQQEQSTNTQQSTGNSTADRWANLSADDLRDDSAHLDTTGGWSVGDTSGYQPMH